MFFVGCGWIIEPGREATGRVLEVGLMEEPMAMPLILGRRRLGLLRRVDPGLLKHFQNVWVGEGFFHVLPHS